MAEREADPVTISPEPISIAMWSGPRTLSTAMMRACEYRDDCAVVDVQVYAH